MKSIKTILNEVRDWTSANEFKEFKWSPGSKYIKLEANNKQYMFLDDTAITKEYGYSQNEIEEIKNLKPGDFYSFKLSKNTIIIRIK